MSQARIDIAFTLGARRLLSVPRRLARLAFSLEDVLAERVPPLPDLSQAEGLQVLSAPAALVEQLAAHLPDHVLGGRQDYPRHYIAMEGDFETYMARFSGKTRSTLRRKQRRLAREIGVSYAVEVYRTPAEVARFLDLAAPLSAATYQARLLDAGLPADEKGRAELLDLAERDRLRCFLLHAGKDPIAYLALPVTGDTLVYAYLGYAPGWARYSPGTVLQLEALERLFAERRYRYFDFTEGDGPHKALFGTHSVACASFVLLEDRVANRLLLQSLATFESSVARARGLAEGNALLARARRLLR